MKLKHWAGYGTVEAKCIERGSDFLKIEVTGSHECGLERDDTYDIFNWLVKRFDRKHKSYMEILGMEIVTRSSGKPYEEICTYTIRFRETI